MSGRGQKRVTGGYDANTYIHVTVRNVITCKYYMLIGKIKD